MSTWGNSAVLTAALAVAVTSTRLGLAPVEAGQAMNIEKTYLAAVEEAAVADPWEGWMQVPDKKPRGKQITEKVPFPECPAGTTPTPDWTSPDDGQSRQTPALPLHSGPSLCEEGPYYVTDKKDFTGFKLRIEYQAIKGGVTPIKKPKKGDNTKAFTPGNPTNQDFANSGVYIFDRYEIQIIDPYQFNSEMNTTGGVPKGAPIPNDPRGPGPNKFINAIDGNRNNQLPGSLYGVDVVNPKIDPANRYDNHANKTGEWNTLVIEFCPPKLSQGKITQAAQLKTTLNGFVEYLGEIRDTSDAGTGKPGQGKALSGTGSRANPDVPPLDSGPLYLQSHWGSQVKFRKPEINALTCPLL